MKRLLLIVGLILTTSLVTASLTRQRRDEPPKPPQFDAEVERWVAGNLEHPGFIEIPAHLDADRRAHFDKRMSQELQLRRAAERAEIEAKHAKQQADADANGGLNAADFAELCQLQYMKDENWRSGWVLPQRTQDQTRRFNELWWLASTEQKKAVPRQWHGGKLFLQKRQWEDGKWVVNEDHTQDPVLVAIAEAFQKQDPHKDVPQNHPNLIWCDSFPTEEVQRNDDGSYTLTVQTFWRHYKPITSNYRDIERWRWDGERLERLDCRANVLPKGIWGGYMEG